jgi:tetratricopeptide (TPR) repeat protein
MKNKKRVLTQIEILALLLGMGIGPINLAQQSSDLSKFSNEELLGKAERAFLMRNFLASEKYYRELNDRLQRQLSSLKPNETQEQIEIDEELILAPFGLGHSLIYLHHYAEARQALENGIKIYPDWAGNHAPMLFFQDPLFTGPVLSDLERLMKASQDEVPWLLHGYIQFFSDNLQVALSSFSHVLDSNKESFLATYFLKQIQVAQKQNPPPSLQSFNANQVDKLPVEELINYAELFFKKSDYDMAAKLFKRAIDTKKDLPVVHIAYGDSLFALGKFEEATQAIIKGLKIYPKYAESRINRRDFYGNPSDFDFQLQKLESYVHSNPTNLNAKFLLGYNYFFIQDYEKADEQLQAVLTNKSLHSSARYLHSLIQKYGSQKVKDPL